MVLFTHNVKKIKGAAHKNGDVDGKCRRTLYAIVLTVILFHRSWTYLASPLVNCLHTIKSCRSSFFSSGSGEGNDADPVPAHAQ